MERTSDRDHPQSTPNPLKRLKATPGVTALTLSEGQVIVYREHCPTGIYVLLSGALAAEGGTGTLPRRREFSAASKPFAVPAPDDIERPSELTFSITKRSRALFVPRLMVLADAEVRRCLAELPLPD